MSRISLDALIAEELGIDAPAGDVSIDALIAEELGDAPPNPMQVFSDIYRVAGPSPDRERSFKGELLAGVVGGAYRLPAQGAGVLSAAGAGLESMIGPNMLSRAADVPRQYVEPIMDIRLQQIGQDPDRPIARALGEGATQLAFQTALGLGTGGLGPAAQVGAFAAGGVAPVVGSTFNEAVGQTGDREGAALEAAINGAVTGVTSVLPGMAILNRIPGGSALVKRATATALGRVGLAAAAEGSQEFIEQVGQEVTRDLIRLGVAPDAEYALELLTDAERWRERGIATLVGGVLGGAARGGLEALPERRGGIPPARGTPPAPDAAGRLQTPADSGVVPGIAPDPALSQEQNEAIDAIMADAAKRLATPDAESGVTPDAESGVAPDPALSPEQNAAIDQIIAEVDPEFSRLLGPAARPARPATPEGMPDDPRPFARLMGEASDADARVRSFIQTDDQLQAESRRLANAEADAAGRPRPFPDEPADDTFARLIGPRSDLRPPTPTEPPSDDGSFERLIGPPPVRDPIPVPRRPAPPAEEAAPAFAPPQDAGGPTRGFPADAAEPPSSDIPGTSPEGSVESDFDRRERMREEVKRKPLKSLTDEEWEFLKSQTSAFADRHPGLSQFESRTGNTFDPRFYVRIRKGEPGYQPGWPDDQQPFFWGLDAIRDYVRTGALPERGRTIERVAQMWLDNLAKVMPGTPPPQKLIGFKAADAILGAIERGKFNDYLRPENKAARATFTQLTGIKLPKTLKDTAAVFTGKPIPMVDERATAPESPMSRPIVRNNADKPIGTNLAGQPLFEDDRGVRSYIENGIRINEPVLLGPRGEIRGPNSRRSDEFKTVEEMGQTPSAPTPDRPAIPTPGNDRPSTELPPQAGEAGTPGQSAAQDPPPTRQDPQPSEEDARPEEQATASGSLGGASPEGTGQKQWKGLIKRLRRALGDDFGALLAQENWDEDDRGRVYSDETRGGGGKIWITDEDFANWLQNEKTGPGSYGQDDPDWVRIVSRAKAIAFGTEQDSTTPAAPPEPGKPKSVAEHFADAFLSGQSFGTIVEARRFVAEKTGQTIASGTVDAKQIEEQIEHGVVLAARRIVGEMPDQSVASRKVAYDRLVALYSRQPNLRTRTGQSMLLQAYSTPVPLAFVASSLARVSGARAVYEPTAGTGMLLIEADPQRTTANELDPTRRLILDQQGFQTTDRDAAEGRPEGGPFDVIIGNPPFGTVPDPAGGNKRWPLGTQGRTDQIDHAIVQKSLEAMRPDGRAVFIVGSKRDMKTGEPAYDGRSKPFYRWLYAHYNVVDHFTVSGDLYTKQGAGFPVDVIVIQGRGRSSKPVPAVEPPRVYDRWEDLWSAALEDPGAGDSSSEPRPNDGGGPSGPEDAQPGGVRDVPPGSAPNDDGPRGPRGPSSSSSSPGTTPGNRRPGTNSGVRPGRDRPASQDSQRVGVPGNNRPSDGPGADPGVRTNSPRDVGASASSSDGVLTSSPEDAETPTQARYVPGAVDAQSVGTVVPREHSAPLAEALGLLKDEVGGITAFVAKEMGWTVEQARQYLSAEQMDAVALAITQSQNNAGIVLGDQTGVGKGRVVATMLAWARKNGMVPVFVTQDAKLYGDMLRDLEDIGMPDALLLPTNGDLKGSKAIANERPNAVRTVRGALDAIREFAQAVGDGKRSDWLAVATTYSQLQGTSSAARRQVFFDIAPNAFVVLDESHNAGGTDMDSRERSRQHHLELGKQKGSFYFREMLSRTRSVMYSSATWAKRPTVMDLYSKTDLRFAVNQIEVLGDAIKRGGVALQQIVSRELVRLGQYIRRERSFKGVEYTTETVSAARDQVAAVTAVYAQISAIDRLMEPAVDAYLESLGAEAEQGDDSSVGEAGIESSNFTSQIHNAISQMNLAAKTEAAVDHIIRQVRAGEKVVIALENTMQRVIEQGMASEGANPGDPADVSFKNRVLRYLERSLEVKIREPNDQGGFSVRTETVPESFWSEELKEAVAAARSAIEALDVSRMPVSPIDWLLFRLRQEGINAGEITGRSLTLDYQPDGSARYGTRPTSERNQAAQRRTIAAFQNGKLDVVILNASGATGISLHADRKRSTDHRPRRMLILQPIRNIDVFMQALGRIHRTGQVVLPRYTMLLADIPSEKRPGALLAKKMASLSANVSSAREGDVKFEAPDLFNEVGDWVLAQWEASPEGQDVLRQAYGSLDRVPDAGGDPGEWTQKVTGRFAILPLDLQEEVWSTLKAMYDLRLEELTALGENPLQVNVRDLNATVIETVPFTASRVGPRSWFTSPSRFEKIEAKLAEKPPTSARLEQMAREYHPDWNKENRQRMQRARTWYQGRAATFKDGDRRQAFMAESEEAARRFVTLMEKARPGTYLSHPDLGQVFVLRVVEDDRTKNPIAMSRFTVVLAVPDERMQVSVTLASIENTDEGLAGLARQDFDDFAADPVMRRWVLRGNLIAGYEALANRTGVPDRAYMLTYTMRDQEPATGLVLPRAITDEWVKSQSQSTAVQVKNPYTAAKALDRYPLIQLQDDTNTLVIQRNRRGDAYEAVLPTDRRSSVRFLAMRTAAEAARADFVRRSTGQYMDIPAEKLSAVVLAFSRAGVVFSFSLAPEAQNTNDGLRQLNEAIEQYGANSEDAGGGPTSAPPTGPERSRFVEMLDRVERSARARMRARVQAMGTTLYSGFDPTLLAQLGDVAIIAAARALRAGVRQGRRLTKIVREVIAEFRPGADETQVRKIARGLITDAAAGDGGVNADGFERAVDAMRRRMDRLQARERPKRTIERQTGVEASRPSKAGETPLQVTLGAAEKAATRAWRASRQAAIAELRPRIEGIRAQMRAEMARRVADAKARGEAAVDREKIRAEVIQGIRDQILGIARTVPLPVRGVMVTDVAKATTFMGLIRASRRAQKAIYRFQAREAYRRLRRLSGAKRARRLTQERRDRLAEAYAQGTSAYLRAIPPRKAPRPDLNQLRVATDQVIEAMQTAAEIHAEHQAEVRTLKALRGMSIQDAAAAAAKNIRAAKDPLAREAREESPEVSWVARRRRGALDFRGALELVEGVYDDSGVLFRTVWRSLTRAEERYFALKRDLTRDVEQALQRAGYASLSAAFDGLTRVGGVDERVVSVRLGGKARKIGLGEAINLLANATDPDTYAQIIDGVPIQFGGGKFNDPIEVTADDLAELAVTLRQYIPLIVAFKGILDSTRPAVFRAHFQIKGYEPIRVRERWPRQRNLEAVSRDIEIPSGAAGFAVAALENMGFLKERSAASNAPIVINDVLNVMLEAIDNSAKVAHLAVPIRDAAGVLLHPEVRSSIAERWGPGMWRSLRNQLWEASRANTVLATGGAILVHELNANIAVSTMAANPRTWARTLAGAIRLAPILGAKHFVAGVRAAKDVTFDDLTRRSGYFWDRYVGNPAGRLSAVMAADAPEAPTLLRAAKLTARNLRAGRVGDAYRSWRRTGRKAMEIINFFDSIIGRIALAGFRAKARDEHPEWSQARRDRWAIERAASAIRETQNGSSPLDLSMEAAQNRNSGLAAFFLFTSEPFKTYNRLRRAKGRGRTEFVRTASAEAAQIAIGIMAAQAIGWTIASGVSAALGGDDEDQARINERFWAPQRLLLAAANDLLGALGMPIVGGAVVQSLYTATQGGSRGNELSPAALDVLQQLLSAGVNLGRAATADDEERADRFVRALEQFVSAAFTATGLNPLQAAWRMLWGEAKQHLAE